MFAILTHYSINQCRMVGYSFVGLIALLVNAARRELVCDMALLEPSLLERASLDPLRAVREQHADTAVALLLKHDPSIAMRQFLDLIALNRFTHPRV